MLTGSPRACGGRGDESRTAPRCTPRHSAACAGVGSHGQTRLWTQCAAGRQPALLRLGVSRRHPRSRCHLTGPVRGCRPATRSRRVLDRDAPSAATSFTIRSTANPITALAWSPAGKTLAVGSHGGSRAALGRGGGPRRERSLVGLQPLPGQIEAIQVLAFSPDRAAPGRQRQEPGDRYRAQLVSPLASTATWEVGTGAWSGSRPSSAPATAMNGSDVLAFSHDGKLLAATMLTGGIRVFDPSTGSVLRTLADPGDDGISLAFAPRGTLLAEGTLGGTVEMWDRAHRQAPRATAARRYRGDRRPRV